MRSKASCAETLITLAASLKAGHAFNSALASVVKEGADPTSKELGRVAQEIQLGHDVRGGSRGDGAVA